MYIRLEGSVEMYIYHNNVVNYFYSGEEKVYISMVRYIQQQHKIKNWANYNQKHISFVKCKFFWTIHMCCDHNCIIWWESLNASLICVCSHLKYNVPTYGLYTAMQCQKTVNVYLNGEQLPPFGLADNYITCTSMWLHGDLIRYDTRCRSVSEI